ncbi:MAG: hypothetical protein DRR08_33570, partial [Candidatus Parabeggiatoa sp. nov. 2]
MDVLQKHRNPLLLRVYLNLHHRFMNRLWKLKNQHQSPALQMTTMMVSIIVTTDVQELLTGLRWILAVAVLILVHWMTTTMGSKIVMTSVQELLTGLKWIL